MFSIKKEEKNIKIALILIELSFALVGLIYILTIYIISSIAKSLEDIELIEKIKTTTNPKDILKAFNL